MSDDITKILDRLIESLADIDLVKAIGISGKLKPYPTPGNGDFDIFIYCDEIPDEKFRVDQMSGIDGIDKVKSLGSSEAWGHMNYCTIEGIDTFAMFFRVTDVLKNIEEIRSGKHLWKETNGYFPVGRLAMLSSINILYDNAGFLSRIKESLGKYPKLLKEKMISFHIPKMLSSEDFLRAIYRKDIIFYHHALDNAIEHFLMTLFAVNETYFPSRKRSQEYINTFEVKPMNCLDRLLSVIKESIDEDRMENSYKEFRSLCKELKQICE